jgi:hypothetical protein
MDRHMEDHQEDREDLMAAQILTLKEKENRL